MCFYLLIINFSNIYFYLIFSIFVDLLYNSFSIFQYYFYLYNFWEYSIFTAFVLEVFMLEFCARQGRLENEVERKIHQLGLNSRYILRIFLYIHVCLCVYVWPSYFPLLHKEGVASSQDIRSWGGSLFSFSTLTFFKGRNRGVTGKEVPPTGFTT